MLWLLWDWNRRREGNGAGVHTWLSEVWSFTFTSPGSFQDGLLHYRVLPSATPWTWEGLSLGWLLLYPSDPVPGSLLNSPLLLWDLHPRGLASWYVIHSPIAGWLGWLCSRFWHGTLNCPWGNLSLHHLYNSSDFKPSILFYTVTWISLEAMLVWFSPYECCILTIDKIALVWLKMLQASGGNLGLFFLEPWSQRDMEITCFTIDTL